MLRGIAVAAATLGLLGACGSSAGPNTESGDAKVFHDAVSGTLVASSFRFSIVTTAGSGPIERAEGAYLAPDRSRLASGGVERITIGHAAYFRGGGFGTSGWAKSESGVTGDLDFRALLVSVEQAAPIKRRGAVYTFDTGASSDPHALHVKLRVDGTRVSRVQYASGRGVKWSERFFDYGTAPRIDEPNVTDTHPLTTVPNCAGGAASSFDGFCTKASS